MDKNIINSFIYNTSNNLEDIYLYLQNHTKIIYKKNLIKKNIKKLIKKHILYINNNYYFLTDEGKIILNDYIIYYQRIIKKFWKKKIYIKLFELKEKRKEQASLRKYLINNKKHICFICKKKLPLCLLETAHIKPRCLLKNIELVDYNVVEFMCKYCHCLFDNGFITIYNNKLLVSKKININNFDLEEYIHLIDKDFMLHNKNKIYFDFHYKFIFKQ